MKASKIKRSRHTAPTNSPADSSQLTDEVSTSINKCILTVLEDQLNLNDAISRMTQHLLNQPALSWMADWNLWVKKVSLPFFQFQSNQPIILWSLLIHAFPILTIKTYYKEAWAASISMDETTISSCHSNPWKKNPTWQEPKKWQIAGTQAIQRWSNLKSKWGLAESDAIQKG